MEVDDKEIELEKNKKKKKILKQWWFWIVISIVLIGIIATIILLSNKKEKIIDKKEKNIGYQVSELIPITTSTGTAYLKGSIKNVSNKDCKEIKINVEYSNGTLVEKRMDYFR